MQATLLAVALTILVQTAHSVPFNIAEDAIDMQTILSQDVPKNKVTDIISEIIGMDVVEFSEQTKLAALDLLQIISTANDQFQNISSEASPEFKVEINKIILKTIGRFTALLQRVVKAVESLPETSPVVIVKNSLAKVVSSFRELERNGNEVSKEEVVKIIDEFLDTTFTSTIRQELRYSKVLVEIVFIIDEANVAVSSVIANEKPEIAERIQVLITSIENSVMTTIRPLIELLKPLILSDINMEKPIPI